MEDVKSLLRKENEVITPRKIVNASLYANGNRINSYYIVLSVGIDVVTAVQLTNSSRYAAIPSLRIPRGLIDDLEYFVKIHNIRNIKFKDITEVISTVPDDLYFQIVSSITLSFLGFSRIVTDDEGYDRFEIIQPRIKLDNPLCMILSNLYNPIVDEPNKEIVKLSKEEFEKQEELNEHKPIKRQKRDTKEPVISTETALSILEELKDAGAFISTSTMDERIDKIYRVFDSHACYPKGMLCISNAHNAIFYGGNLSNSKKQLTIDKTVFKLYLTLNRYDLEEKFPEIPSDRLYDVRNKVINIYNGYINSNNDVSQTYDIALRIKESGIVKKKQFIDAFVEEAKDYYKDEADTILAAQSLYGSVICDRSKAKGGVCSFEEKKSSIIDSALVSSFDRADEVKKILENITKENVTLYSNGTLKWSQKDTDGVLDAVILFSIEKFIGIAGEESFFVLRDDNKYIAEYFYITPFDSIANRFDDDNVNSVLCKIKALSDIICMSDEQKAKFIANGDDAIKLAGVLDIYINRALSGHLSKRYAKKAAELMGVSSNILITAISKCDRFNNVRLLTAKQKKETTSHGKKTTKSKTQKNDAEIINAFRETAVKSVNDKLFPFYDTSKFNESVDTKDKKLLAAFEDQFNIGFSSNCFDFICKKVGIRPNEMKKVFSENKMFMGYPIKPNSYLSRMLITGKNNSVDSVNVYLFDRTFFGIMYTKNIIDLSDYNFNIPSEKKKKISDHNEKLATEKSSGKFNHIKEEKTKVAEQFSIFANAATKYLSNLKHIEYGVKYHDIPNGIYYTTGMIIAFDTYAFEEIISTTKLNSGAFRKLIAPYHYFLTGSNDGSTQVSNINIPIVNRKSVTRKMYVFSAEVFNKANEDYIIANPEVLPKKDEKEITKEEITNDPIVEVIPNSSKKQKDEPKPIPVGQMEGKKKTSKNKEEKPAVKINVKGDYASRFLDTASSVLADKSVPLYPFGAYLKEIPSNGAVYFGKDLVAFDKVIFERICNQAALPLKETQKALFDRGYLVETKHDAKYSYYSRYMLHVYGQRPQEINVFKLKSSCFDGMSFS